jgi:hypothetical protein
MEARVSRARGTSFNRQTEEASQSNLEGAIKMLDEWRAIIDEAQNNEARKWEHIEGIDRIYQKIQLEGALKVNLPEGQQGASQ